MPFCVCVSVSVCLCVCVGVGGCVGGCACMRVCARAGAASVMVARAAMHNPSVFRYSTGSRFALCVSRALFIAVLLLPCIPVRVFSLGQLSSGDDCLALLYSHLSHSGTV